MKFNFDFENIKKIDKDAIKAFEKKHGVEIPSHLMALVNELNGAYTGNSVIKLKGGLYGVQGFVDFSQIEWQAHYTDAPTREYLPIAFSGSGDYFLLQFATDQIYFCDHELEYPENMTLLFDSLDEFIQAIQRPTGDEVDVKPKLIRSWVDPVFEEKMIKLGIKKNSK